MRGLATVPGPILGPVLGAALGSVMLVGCVPAELPDRNACGAAGLQGLVGQDQAVLAAMTLPPGTRVIAPGTPVTQDFGASRLNIDLDAAGRITRLWCG